MVALPHQRPGLDQLGPRLGQVAERADLPGQVVQAGMFGAGGRAAGADLEQAEVVVVGRDGRAQERGPAGDLQADFEAQRLGVELDGALQTVHVQHSVVQAADGHRRFLPSASLGFPRRTADSSNSLRGGVIPGRRPAPEPAGARALTRGRARAWAPGAWRASGWRGPGRCTRCAGAAARSWRTPPWRARSTPRSW